MKTISRRGVLSVFLLLAGALQAQTEIHNGREVKARQVLLRLTGAGATVRQRLLQIGDADDFRPINRGMNIYVLHSRSANVATLLSALQQEQGIAYVEPDYLVKAVAATPNDVEFPQQWALLNTANPGADIGATGAWNISTGGTTSVAGVVDTGIDYTHPDLAANVWSAPSSFTVTLSWGTLACPAGSHGYNAIKRSCDPQDDNGHGTHVSGTIGAVGNNDLGVVGVNWTARMMALKFMDSTGTGYVSDAIDAIEFGLQSKSIFGSAANLRVLSNSWGGADFSQALLDEINRANTADVLFVVAAGNGTQNIDTTPTYPASYTAANIVAVAATTNTDGLASFSNFGLNSVDLGAPGLNIISTYPNSSYATLSGTSMATPHVAGAALLLLSACRLNTAALKQALIANVDPISSLSGITVSGGRLNVSKAIHSCAGPSSGTASFVKADTTTTGSWKGVYGSDGYSVIGDSASTPSYVSITPSGNSTYVWNASTADVRALQKASASDRIAGCWYTSTSMTTDLRFNDSNTHQVAMYLLDWDNYSGRTERIDILDANNNVLDTRSVSNFVGGEYLVWNLSGHVTVRVTNTNSNAVVSGLFFGVGGATATASFVKTDTTTTGSWKGAYGSDGYNVIGDSVSTPSYVSVTPSGNSTYVWNASTADVRALQKASATDRLAGCWYTSTSMTIDLRFDDSNTHQVAFYLLDWDNYSGRTERIDILDSNNNVLDTRSVSNFVGGEYLVWNLSGHVIVRVTNTNSNAVVSGLFFGTGGAVATAAFLKTDTTTSGSWKSVYGADGDNIMGDSASTSSYVSPAPSGNTTYVWDPSTTDIRALQKAAAADRIAGCWYTSTSMTIDLPFTDGNTHQVALYLLDWDNYLGRNERIDILDSSNKVLDTRSVTNFTGGEYLVWNLSGHVTIRVTNINPSSNAVVSGLFFR